MNGNRDKIGFFSGIFGVCINLLLCTVKLIVGYVSASVAVMADGVNNLSDTFNSVLTIVAFKLSAKPADNEHPFGHQRYEYIFGMLISFVIMMLGISLLKNSVSKIFSPVSPQVNMLMISIMLISVFAKLVMFAVYRKLSKKINSVTLKATAQDCLNDVISTGAIILSLIIGEFIGFSLDGYMGVIVSGVIIYSGIRMISETLNPLLGQMPDGKIEEELNAKVLSYDGIIGIHDTVIHSYGPETIFATLHAEVSAEEDTIKSHDLIDNIEMDMWKTMHIHLVIHLDPVVVNDERVTRANEYVKGVVSEINPKLSIHDFRIVFGVTHDNFIFDVVVPFDYKDSIDELIQKIKTAVSLEYEKANTVINIDRKYIK